MDPDDWQQPQQFRPERFLGQSGNVADKDRVIPFSLGMLRLTLYSNFLQSVPNKSASLNLLPSCGENFVKSLPILKMFSPLEAEVEFDETLTLLRVIP